MAQTEQTGKSKEVYLVHVKAFPDLKFISVSLKGTINSDACHELIQKIREIMPEMSPGFAYLNDMTLVEELKFETYQQHIEIMAMLRDHGLTKVARVLGDEKKDIGLKVASLFHYDGEVSSKHYSTVTQALSAILT